MTITNHAITGAVIGLAVHNLSHFVCDAIPHFGVGERGSTRGFLKSKGFKSLLLFDALGCVSLAIVIFLLSPKDWFLVDVCAFLATSPDLLWLPMFINANQNKLWKHNLIMRFDRLDQLIY
jgi:hypothetical protein